MKRLMTSRIALALLAALLLGPRSPAQDLERVFCDDATPGASCSDDTIEVVFPSFGAFDRSVLEYSEFVPGTRIDAEIVIGAASTGIQGWSYAVRHDPAVLEVIPDAVTTAGTVVDDVFKGGFNVTQAVDGGMISAIVLSFTDPAELPIGRQRVGKSAYRLIADASPDGTVLEVVDGEIGPPDSPPTSVNITVDGQSFQPRRVVDGLVRKQVVADEVCDNGVDDDGDGLVDLEDFDCLFCSCPPVEECPDYAFFFGTDPSRVEVDARGQTSFAISSRNARALLGFQFGVSRTPVEDVSLYRFSGSLGTDENRLVEVLMTDDAGDSVAPQTPNRLLADPFSVVGVERGPALAGFADGDFLEFDLAPGVGGPGFFVGYVSDLDGDVNRIAATGGKECGVNELLRVRLGASECPNYALYFGSTVGEGTLDARGETSYAISARNRRALLGFQFGVRTRDDAGGVIHEFAGDLGTDSDRLVEVLMTDSGGNSLSPATPNRVLASSGKVVSVERGSALSAFADGDFLAFDTDPGVGGPGWFVGYVSDLEGDIQQLPATAAAEEGGECPLNELLIVKLEGGGAVCPDDGLIFGAAGTSETADAAGADTFVISARNSRELLAFQFGVGIAEEAGLFRYAFSAELGTDENRLVEPLFTDVGGDSISPRLVNDLTSDVGSVARLQRGASIAGFEGGDFFEFDLAPGVGGPGFFVGYVSDLDDDVQRIAATAAPAAGECPLNELVVVETGVAVDRPFFRGDADGSGRLSVSDAVIIIQVVVGNFTERFDCDDALDADDNEKLDVVDALPVLAYIFQQGPVLAAPFLACGVDATGPEPGGPDGGLDCRESNCAPAP